jgi:hypothetical protein
MNKINDNQLFLCRYVSDLFEYSTKKKDCSSKVFIKAYVYSFTSTRINNECFLFDSLDIPAAYDCIKKEKKLNRGHDIYPSYVMAWIGYIMEYFTCVTNIPLTSLYRKIKPEELYMLYEAYHSLDNDLVVQRICEAKGIHLNLNDVELLKKIYYKNTK